MAIKQYYSGERIASVDATYKILLGGRNLGKSYDTKCRIIRECYERGKEFTYLRRYNEDVKHGAVENYFADLKIENLTDNNYKGVTVFRGCIFLCNYNEDGKPVDKKLIGWVHSLSEGQRYKSQMFPNVVKTIYEEFIVEDGKGYLQDEPNKLLQYVSTVYRENKGVVYLIGNTITKLCPYYSEWELTKINKMKAGDIDVYENTTTVLTEDGEEELVVKIAVEMCTAKNVFSKMAFGSSASMIVKNEWQARLVPRVDDDILFKCKDIYTVFAVCDNLKFRLLLKQYNNYVFWFVVPHTKEFVNPNNTRIINPNPSPHRLHTTSFKGLTPNEQKAFSLMRENKIFYPNNETGTDFIHVLKKVGY